MSERITVGIGENIVEVPLFAQLGGYGPFRGRRNLGVRDPLYCRVLSINDGHRRNVVVVTDMLHSEDKACRLLRMELACDFALYPESIMFVSTHTHSSACIGSCDVGYGDHNEEFYGNWRRTVHKTLEDAIASEEPVRAYAGTAPIRKPIGQRRTTSADKHTDPEIRFVKFVRADGSRKILLHNYGMHGVVFGPQPLVSGDWMGDANAKLKARGATEVPFYLYGTAGDVNVIWTHPKWEERHLNLDWIGTSYVDDLMAGLDNCQEISLGPVNARLKTIELPTEPVKADEYRQNAAKLLTKLPNKFEKLIQYIHDRMQEMALLAERGHDFRVLRDLQALRMGDLEIYAVPGEPFLAVGEEIRAASEAKFPLVVSVANGDAGYYPTREMFEQYPDMFCCDDFGAFGFYEVWFGPGLLRAKYQPQIVAFLVANLLQIGRGLDRQDG